MTWQPDYITAEQLAGYAKADAAADADELAAAVTAASREVDKFCHRQFGQSAAGTVRYYDARWSDYRSVFIADVDDFFGTPAAVEVDDGSGTYTAAGTAPVLLHRNAPADLMPFTRLTLPGVKRVASRDAVRVTHQWGWPSFPVPVVQATLLQGNRLLFRDSPYGIAGSPDAGSELRLLAKIDPDSFVALGKYVRTPMRTG